MAKHPNLLAEGKDYAPEKGFFNNDLTFNLPAGPTIPGPVYGVGTPVSATAFAEMKSRYQKNKKPNDTEYVTFGREAILSLLAQYNCAGIKFYFVERHDTTTGQLTVAMVGVDPNNNDLNNVPIGVTAPMESTLAADFGVGFPPSI